jgi:hypothetical protein
VFSATAVVGLCALLGEAASRTPTLTPQPLIGSVEHELHHRQPVTSVRNQRSMFAHKRRSNCQRCTSTQYENNHAS